MSEEMTILPGRGTRVDSSLPQQPEITVDNHRQNIDELLEVIRAANGIPVLLVTSSDGRLSAIAMNMVPTNHEVNGSTGNKYQDFRAWILLIASLMATAAFTAGLTPPGGFWADDKAADKDGKDGHVAGTSVMSDKFPHRYRIFQVNNSLTFFYSLMVIGVIGKNVVDNESNSKLTKRLVHLLSVEGVIFSLVSFGISYISGTWDDKERGKLNIFTFALALFCIFYHWFFTWYSSRRSGEQPPDTNNS